MLGLLVEQTPTTNVLALLGFRPEFTPLWGSHAYMTPMLLNRLTRRLSNQMVGRLTGGRNLPEEIISQVAAKSDGVPLFVEELTRMVVESDLVRLVDDQYALTGSLPELAIPSTLQDSLTARLDRLSSVKESVQLAAVLGREFDFELIRAVSPLDESTLLSHLQHLIDTEFLYLRGRSLETTYRFKHALIQDAAYASLLRSTRQQYHHHVAVVLEEHFADVVATQPELVAHHYTEAGLIQEAVPYWHQAGERALATLAHEEARIYFLRALAANKSPSVDSETAALYFGLGRALVGTLERHQLQEAVVNFSRAFDNYAQNGYEDIAVAIAEYPIFSSPGRSTGLADLIHQALTLVPRESIEAGRLLCRDGLAVGHEEGQYTDAQQAFAQAVEIARRKDDLVLEVSTMANAASVDLFQNQFEEALRNSGIAIELGGLVDDLQAEVTARYVAINSLLAIGGLERAKTHAEAMLIAAEKLRDRYWLTTAYSRMERISRLQGDWDSARAFNNQGLELLAQDTRLLASRAVIECEVGDYAQSNSYLNRVLEVMRLIESGPNVPYAIGSLVIPMISRISGAPTELAVARSASEAVIGSPIAPHLFVTWARTGLALMESMGSEGRATNEIYRSLESSRGSLLITAILVDRVLGLLAAILGMYDQARKHFEDALAFCRNGGYRPELAWTCCDYADMLRSRDEDEDRGKANALLDESLAISSDLGMRPLMERVLSRREILGT